MTISAVRNPSTVTVHVPMRFAIRGGRKMVIAQIPQGSDEAVHEGREGVQAVHELPDVPSTQRSHNALTKALARAHRWRRTIENGEYASITELAQAQKVNQSYACRMLRLTLLAPAIIVDILDGRHGSHLMLKHLMKPLSVRWNEQVDELKIGRVRVDK